MSGIEEKSDVDAQMHLIMKRIKRGEFREAYELLDIDGPLTQGFFRMSVTREFVDLILWALDRNLSLKGNMILIMMMNSNLDMDSFDRILFHPNTVIPHQTEDVINLMYGTSNAKLKRLLAYRENIDLNRNQHNVLTLDEMGIMHISQLTIIQEMEYSVNILGTKDRWTELLDTLKSYHRDPEATRRDIQKEIPYLTTQSSARLFSMLSLVQNNFLAIKTEE